LWSPPLRMVLQGWRDLDNRQGEIMDTISATEDMTPRSLMTHIEGVWEQKHETDPARASDLICERLAKDGASAKEIVCDHLGIGTFDPDVVLRAIVAEEYARSLSAEDRLVFGAGLKPETAECIMALMDAAAMADEAATDLQEALAQEDFDVICRQVREDTEGVEGVGLTDADEAAMHMLVRMPALAEIVYGIPITLDMVLTPQVRGPLALPDTCEHRVRTHVLAALAKCYQDCMAESGANS
jgi:hypothetical protein